MTTKERILDVDLKLFSVHGYSNVYVAMIAAKVGINSPSLYKHYNSKKDILDAILKLMDRKYEEEAKSLSSKQEFTIEAFK